MNIFLRGVAVYTSYKYGSSEMILTSSRFGRVRSNPFLPEHAGLKAQGSSPMDYDMLRLFRSEASCDLLYALLEMDPEIRPNTTESLEYSWFFELASW